MDINYHTIAFSPQSQSTSNGNEAINLRKILMSVRFIYLFLGACVAH